MGDRDLLALDRSQGERLELEEYRRDFQLRDEAVTGRDSWKFERQQHFQELSSPSWEAFRRGEWQESLRLTGEELGNWQRIVQEDRARETVFHRVRIVEEPLTPYLQWELHSLRVQGESGMPVRVVDGEGLRPFERVAPLPEVVVLGGRVLYEVLYTDEGFLNGGVRYTDAELIGRWEEFIQQLYAGGEEIASYVDRYVSHLPAPKTSQAAGHQ